MNVRYAVIFEKAQNNWAAYVPDLPGCITTGKTLEETERNIRQAIEGHLLRNTRKTELPPASATRVFLESLGARTAPFALQTMREFGDPIPAPTSLAKEVEVSPAA
ncbi:MAG: type II toxin-antitoxin system HicB family antitoxin [Acidobacteriia bacterium]|nr:type II toxin-antitoxin system HicB family antitoxin [Terriglobia bacterium]